MSNPIRNIRFDEIDRAYEVRGLDRLPDAELFEHVIEIASRPKRETSSYSLHIGMETMARFRLLARMPGAAMRTWARKQIVAMAATYEHLSEDIPAPELPTHTNDVEHYLGRLLEAIAAGEVDDADKYACILARIATAEQIAGPLADATLPDLGAAGHTPIFLSLARRLDAAAPTLFMLPNIARGLAEEINAQIRDGAIQPAPSVAKSSADTLGVESLHTAFYRGLLLAPRIGAPPSPGISALVLHTLHNSPAPEAMNHALGLVSGELSRFHWHAAMSGVIAGSARLMLEEDPKYAKYYWTHCLTIPQGVWALGSVLGDRLRALQVACTMALGFRSSLGGKQIDGPLQLPAYEGSLSEALKVGSLEAAAVAYRMPAESLTQMREQLAVDASLRNDAHLVKYTLQCLDCAAMDPARAPLFHAAAAYLVSIWVREIPSDKLTEQLHSPKRAEL